MSQIFAGVELGGTKIVCALAEASGELLERMQIDTQAPEDSLPRIRAELQNFIDTHGPFAALGVGTFGPLQLERSAPDYGRLGPTPKLLWRGCDLYRYFADWLTVPVALDTDVNAAALGEVKWGAAIACTSAVYITVGTGIGGGVIVNGKPVHGLLHPELGHMRVPRATGDDFEGNCPVHTDCIEGMAAGPAIVARWGVQLEQLPSHHVAYEQTAHYIAHLVSNSILLLSPEKIVLGGGVMNNEELFPMIRQKVQALLNGFIAVDAIEKNIDQYIVPPGLGGDAGVLGAIVLAMMIGHR